MPDLVQVAVDCEKFGAEGITIHPRPDQRHARYSDVQDLRKVVQTELNIEGYPTDKFIDVVIKSKPDQVTLVPDEPGALTSDHGWDTVKKKNFLQTSSKIAFSWHPYLFVYRSGSKMGRRSSFDRGR